MKHVKIWVCVMLSLMTCFLSVGYAAVTGNLSITGEAEYYAPPIFISSVKLVNSDGTLSVFDVDSLRGTVMGSTVNLPNASSSVILQITVHNRSEDTYGYNATIAGTDTGSYSNPNITYHVYQDATCTTDLPQGGIKEDGVTTVGTVVAPNGGETTFYIKFTYKDTSNITNTSLHSFLNFDFKTPLDTIIEDAAVDNAVDMFYDILNDHIGDKDYNPLNTLMDNAGSDRNISYIGNVAGANSTEVTKVEDLFDGQLKVNIDGEEKEVKFLLKRENIDGNTQTGSNVTLNYTDRYGAQSVTGWEMVMYMTTEELVRNGWLEEIFGVKKTVYAVVFTSYDGGTTWEQLGEMYQGTASVVEYDGSSGNGSFSTDTWTSGDNNYYNTGTDATIEEILAAYKAQNPTN